MNKQILLDNFIPLTSFQIREADSIYPRHYYCSYKNNIVAVESEDHHNQKDFEQIKTLICAKLARKAGFILLKHQ